MYKAVLNTLVEQCTSYTTVKDSIAMLKKSKFFIEDEHKGKTVKLPQTQ